MATLNDVEVRILGSLIEKQITTPEYYPLTLNSLLNACNQLTNRDPVVHYDDRTIARALDGLREKQLVWVVSQVGGRVPKYEQRMTEGLKLSGEIRGRTNRLYDFKDLEEVELTIQAMSAAQPPLVVKLPRVPGTKESRFAHLLAGEVAVEEASLASPPLESASAASRTGNERLSTLEERIAKLQAEVDQLRAEFSDFRKQFE
jgi:uncharacterized protein YceH (UPF0502 family)